MSTCDSTLTVGIVPGVPQLFRVINISSNHNLSFGDDVVDVDTTAGDVTITLHSLVKRGFHIRKIDPSVNTVIIDGNGVTINGDATKVISSQFVSEFFIGGNTEWELH